MEMHWALLFALVLEAIGAPALHGIHQATFEAKHIRQSVLQSRFARNTEDCTIYESCEELNTPVCGTDGITHQNECKLKWASCQNPEKNITVDYTGNCKMQTESATDNYLVTDDTENNGHIHDIETEHHNGSLSDGDGCLYLTVQKIFPVGTRGYNKCKQVECRPNKTWKPTGMILPNCADGSVACWNWVTNETVQLKGTMEFECNQYSCTEDDWVQNTTKLDPSCVSEKDTCISNATQDVIPKGFKGYSKCNQFECIGNGKWIETGERLPGCSPDEMKCWNWYQNETDAAVPIGSLMFHRCIQYKCTDNDWSRTNVSDPSCSGKADADGCFCAAVDKAFPIGTKGYHLCIQVECKPDKTWKPTGERLPNCPEGSVACWNWVTNQTVQLTDTMDYECNQYLCTEDDWVRNSTKPDYSCEDACISNITQDVLPKGWAGYFMCEKVECIGNNKWNWTGERLPGCSPGEIKCWNWYQNETVPIGSPLFHRCIQYNCTDNDWSQTSVPVPSCSENTCVSPITQNVYPQGFIAYWECNQVECIGNNKWNKTGERLPGCSPGEIRCWDLNQNETAASFPIGTLIFHKCIQYNCTDYDWRRTYVRDPSCSESIQSTNTSYAIPEERIDYDGVDGDIKEHQTTVEEENTTAPPAEVRINITEVDDSDTIQGYELTANQSVSACTPGKNSTDSTGKVCCCTATGALNCTGPCLESESTAMKEMKMETQPPTPPPTTTENTSNSPKEMISLYVLCGLLCILLVIEI